MKSRIAILVLIWLAAGCIPQAVPTTPPTPTIAPAPLTTPTRPSASPTVPPPRALTVRERISLRELGGAGRRPYALAAIGNTIYALNSETENVAVVQNHRVVKYIPVGKQPAALAADPAQKRLYIANAGDKTISLMVGDQVTLTQSLGEEARALLFFENRLFAGLSNKADILVLDPATLQTQTRVSIPNAFSIINLAGDAVHHRLYANIFEKTVVIDSATLRVLTTIPVKGSYYTLAAHPPSDGVLIAAYDAASQSQFLISFDPLSGAERGRVKIGGDPRGAVLNADGSRLYVANSYTNNVMALDPRTPSLLATIGVDLHPYALALDENARRLYVANYDSDNLSVIDTDTHQLTATIPLGMIPTALAADEGAGRVYIANASSDSVYVVEGARVVKEIGVGRHPVDLARDASSNRLFIANRADGTLSIVNGSDFSVRTTQPITRVLTTVAVDSLRARVFAGDVILDLNTLAPIGKLTLRGATLYSQIAPDLVRVNANNNRIYALAWNGTPGSNSRTVPYSVDGNTLQQRGVLSYFGNTSAIEIDPETNRVYGAGTHPMALTNELSAWDANDGKIISLPLPARTTGMAYNPQTHHLFLAHPKSYGTFFGPTPAIAENMIEIFDTTSFGEVARLSVPNAPGKMTRIGNTIYVASLDDGSLTLIEDAPVPTPPSPTPTFTVTPWRTATPITATPTHRATATPVVIAPPLCAIPSAALAAPRWTTALAARIGCPTEVERAANFAAQPFERGTLFWREDEKRIYILFNDKTWAVFDDTWNAALPEDSCPSISVAAGLAKPKRGFGKVWCEQSSVRAKIGAGTVPESSALYPALTQRFERGQMFAGAQAEQVFMLFADGKWE